MVSQVQDAGLKEFVDAIVADDVVKYVGWGTGSGQAVTDSDLATAAAESRTSGTLSAVTTNTTDDTLRCVAQIVATAARAITEVGQFATAATATLRMYADFSVLNLNEDDSITFTIDTVLNQA